MARPLFSILIANYNNGKYFQEAIDSVFAQTYSNWEVIIVDDGSTDESEKIYEKYRDDSRFHIFYNEENRGCAYTKHQCVLHANGEICGYLDPDDVILPNALEVSVSLFEAQRDTVLSFSRLYICNEQLEILRESRPLYLMDGETYFEHKDYRPENFAAFSKTAYHKMGGLDTTLKAGVDADLYFRLEEQGRLAISHEITYKYRLNSTSITANLTKAYYWNLIVRHNVCIRRNLPIDNYSFADFLSFINGSHWDKRAFRLGKLLTHPKSWWKNRRARKEWEKCKY